MLLLWFIVWPLSWLVEFVLDHVSELPEYLVLPLHPLLLAEHSQRPLLVRRINLVFFPQPDSFHPPVPASRHHPAILLIGSDLVTGQTNLSSSWNSLPLSNVSSHSLTLS